MSVSYPPSVYRLLEHIKGRLHDTKYADIPEDLRGALDIALHHKLVDKDSNYQPGPIVGVAYGSAEAAERIAAYRAALNPNYWLTSEGRCALAMYREAQKTGESPGAKDAEQPTDPSKLSRSVSGDAVEALLGDEAQKVLKIARSGRSADSKMREICGIDRRFLGYESPQWADLLGVSDAAIRKTPFWKQDRQRAIEADRELRGE
jgi:hypothetical protein